MKVKSLSRVWLCDPMDCSPPGSSIHGIFRARVLEWGVVCLPCGISTLRLRNLLNYIGWAETLRNLDLVFRVEECKFYLVRINRSQISELPMFIWIVTGFWVPLLSKSSVFKHSVSFTLWCWGILCYSFRVEWHSMEYLDFNSISSNE